MRKIEYVVSDERLITPSGLSLVGQVLGKSNLIKKANRKGMICPFVTARSNAEGYGR